MRRSDPIRQQTNCFPIRRVLVGSGSFAKMASCPEDWIVDDQIGYVCALTNAIFTSGGVQRRQLSTFLDYAPPGEHFLDKACVKTATAEEETTSQRKGSE